MHLTRSRSRVIGIVMKVTTCVAFSLAAFGMAYFTIVDGTQLLDSPWKAFFKLASGLSLSAAMSFLTYRAARMSVDDFVIEGRLLWRHGFRRLRRMSAEEYERRRKIEETTETEVRERTRNIATHGNKAGLTGRSTGRADS